MYSCKVFNLEYTPFTLHFVSTENADEGMPDSKNEIFFCKV